MKRLLEINSPDECKYREYTCMCNHPERQKPRIQCTFLPKFPADCPLFRGYGETQKSMHEWAIDTFGPPDPISVYNHFVDEAKELYQDLEKGIVPREEIADCTILLFQLASCFGLDLLEAIDKKMAVNRKRKWGAPNEQGFTEHII